MEKRAILILAAVVAVFFVSSAVAAVLEITPVDDFEPLGTPGGPFTPSSIDYQLTNTGPNTIWWGVYKTVGWLDVVPDWGPLGPGVSTTVTVSLTSDL